MKNEEKLLSYFLEVAEKVTYYKKLLKDRGVNVEMIRDIDSFKSLVPKLSKTEIYPSAQPHELCMNGDIDSMQSIIISSGTSKEFSYSIISKEEAKNQAKTIDFALESMLDLRGQKVLIINSLPMGVSFYSDHIVVPTGTRIDIAIHVIEKFSKYFDRVIVVTDPNIAKKMIEDGESKGIDWMHNPFSFIIGGAWPSNSLMKYLGEKIGTNIVRDKRNILVNSMGITEIGLNIFFETPDLSLIRDFFQNNYNARSELFGNNVYAMPTLMYYNPDSTYIEIDNSDKSGIGSLVLSTLNKTNIMPMMRYVSGDKGKIIDIQVLMNILARNNCGYSPSLPLPIIAIFDRYADKTKPIDPSLIKELIFRDKNINPYITGHFLIEENRGRYTINVQKRMGDIDLRQWSKNLIDIIHDIADKDVIIKPVEYIDYKHNLEINYDKKWIHI